MDILLIAHAFPPDTAVGSIRARNVATALKEAGHRVQVIAAHIPRTAAGTTEDAGIVVHRVRSFSNPLGVLSGALAKLRSRRPSTQPSLSTGRRVPGWKRHILSLLWVPDDRQGFVGPAVARALRLKRAGVDLLYTTAPPFSDHLAGLALKTLTGVPWVAEFRDPWADNPLNPAERSSIEADAMNRWLERCCLSAADHVVTVAEGTMALLQAKVSEAQRGKFILARNGIDSLASGRRAHGARRPYRVLHAGSLYQDRDPRPFFRAMAALCERQQLGINDIQVDFVGRCDAFRGQSLPEFTKALGIGALVRFTDWVPHDQCRAEMAEADLLVLFAQNNPNQVANKLYEYLGTRRPILAFAEADGESARMLSKVGGHYLISQYDSATIESILERAFLDPIPEPSPGSEALLEEWSTHRQLDHLLSRLELESASYQTSSEGPGMSAQPQRV